MKNIKQQVTFQYQLILISLIKNCLSVKQLLFEIIAW